MSIFNGNYVIRLAYSALVLFFITIIVTLYGFIAINNSRIILVDLHQLKSDVLVANIAMRNSAIANSSHEMNKELDKMLLTRTSANKIYDRLSGYDLTSEDKTIVSEMKKERGEYRKHQMEVIENIKKNVTNHTWMYYNLTLDRYIQRIDILIQSQLDIAKNIYDYTKYTIITILINMIVMIIFCIFFYRKGV